MDRTQCIAVMAAILWQAEGQQDFRRIAAFARILYDAVDVELGCAPPRMENGRLIAYGPEANDN